MNDAQNTRELIISIPEIVFEQLALAADRDGAGLSEIAAEWLVRGMLEEARDERLQYGAMCQVH